MNYTTLEGALNLFAKIARATGNQFRAAAYGRAIVATRMSHGDAELARSQIGDDVRAKIAEYNATGHIRELDELLAQQSTRAALEFDTILGFGPASIRALIARGIYTRAQLTDAAQHRAVKLTHMQDIGLRYYDDLHRTIPRATITRVAEVIIAEIYRASPHAMIEIAGSYRRRLPQSNDIDILVASRGEATGTLLREVHENIRALDRAGITFVDIVALGKSKYSFIVRTSEQIMSVDIILVAQSEFWAALLHFTGSQLFNIWLRELCKKNGFSLSQYGLRDLRTGEMINLESEEHIFRLMGVPFIEPSRRDGIGS